MSVVLRSSDVFATQKLVVRTPKDGRDINQKRVLYKTRLFPTYTEVCREKVYTDVHFWTVYFKRLTEKFVSNAAGYAETLEIRRIYCVASLKVYIPVHF